MRRSRRSGTAGRSRATWGCAGAPRTSSQRRWSNACWSRAGEGGPAESLALAAELRRADVGFLPATAAQTADELELARLAAVIAARRHARPGAEGSRDLTHVGLCIGSGGVLRHADPAAALGVLDAVLTDYAGGWRLPERARVIVDQQYLLAPIGLLEMTGRPDSARALAEELIRTA